MAEAPKAGTAEKKWLSPKGNPESKPFWDAAAQGKFLLKRCKACGEAHFYPRSICPNCFSDDTVWEESKGEGEIYTYSIMRRSPTGPYCLAYVTMKEGPTFMTNIVDSDFSKIKIGSKVKVVFQPTDGPTPVVLFALA